MNEVSLVLLMSIQEVTALPSVPKSIFTIIDMDKYAAGKVLMNT